MRQVKDSCARKIAQGKDINRFLILNTAGQVLPAVTVGVCRGAAVHGERSLTVILAVNHMSEQYFNCFSMLLM